MLYMLDTNICIYLIKRDPPQVLRRLEEHDPGDVVVSAITASELAYGLAKSSRPRAARHALAKFLASFGVLPYDGRPAEGYGHIRAALERRGRLIGPLDLLIAVHALSVGATLVTHKEREFRHAGLTVEDWAT